METAQIKGPNTESRAPAAFLGVESSASGKRWVARVFDERLALTLAQRHGVPDLIARSMASRGVTLDDAAGFLDPKLRDFLPDPSRFKDMDVAASRMVQAIEADEKIAVFGDYDVDGATSSALLLRFGKAVGQDFRLYVPDRIKEGYGPNVTAMENLADEGIKLLLCVDCGTTAHAPLLRAKEKALDVIVLDHHASESELPPACAVVNPNRLDEDGMFGSLAACGVTFLFIIAVNRALRARKFFNATRPEPDLMAWLDLVALGTICDVVKLSGLNRAFATQGLRVMSKRGNVGITALATLAGQKGPMDAYTAGFLLGPRVNAGGRVGDADMGARLLATEDTSLAAHLAERLHGLNTERRLIEAQVLLEAEAITLNDDLPMAFVASENWHPGVIGIVAARLKEKFHHPALVVSLSGDIGKGSARSVNNVDLGAVIIAARQAGLLLNGGGHKMAAGFTVAREKISELKVFLADRIGKQIAAEPLLPTLTLDGLAASTALKPEFVKALQALGPFGSGNTEPRFALAKCRIIQATVVGEKHVSVVIMQGGVRLRGIAFRAVETKLGDALLDPYKREVHIAGYLRIDEWQGDERIQLHISDVAVCVL